jgi:hypothetical protein
MGLEPELETALKEHWEHARHCVRERLWFNNIFAAVIAAIFVFLGQGSGSQGTDVVLIIFGLFISIIGFMVVVALTLGYLHYMNDVTMIFYCWDRTEFWRHPKKPTHFGSTHRYFYEFAIALFLVFFFYRLAQIHWCWLTLGFIVFFAVIETLYQCSWKQYSDECWRFKMALLNDFSGIYRKEWDKWFRNPKFPEFQKRIVDDAERRRIIGPKKEWRICKILRKCRLKIKAIFSF